MILFSVNKISVNPDSLWYHFKNNGITKSSFELTISYDEQKIINLIEKYSQCNIRDEKIKEKIIHKDNFQRSQGLLWHILNHIQDDNKNEFNWEWVLNNITDIKLNSESLNIIGEVSTYTENFSS